MCKVKVHPLFLCVIYLRNLNSVNISQKEILGEKQNNFKQHDKVIITKKEICLIFSR